MKRPSILLFAALAGCAGQSERYPSLSPRPIERLGFEEPAAQPRAPAAPDPALDARLADEGRRASELAIRTDAALREAERRIGRAGGAPAGSDTWLDAQVALGELDVLRAETSEGLTGLEQAAADRGVAGQAPYPALDAAITRAREAVETIAARIDGLQQRLAR